MALMDYDMHIIKMIILRATDKELETIYRMIENEELMRALQEALEMMRNV